MGNTSTKVALGVFFATPIFGAIAEIVAEAFDSTPPPPSAKEVAESVAAKTSAVEEAPPSPSPSVFEFEVAKKAAREAAEAVFEAITKAANVASRYMTSLCKAVASAAVITCDAMRRFTAEAYDAVRRAAASVSSLAVELIERLHGPSSAALAKAKLDDVNGIPGAAFDVSSFVALLLDGIKRASAPAFPGMSFGQLALPESPTAKSAAASAADMTGLLRTIFTVEEMLGFEIPTVAINVVVAAAKVVLALCSSGPVHEKPNWTCT
jgi:hypothetical protein